MKIVQKKSTENCHFTAVKNRCILHGRVFVMTSPNSYPDSSTPELVTLTGTRS